MIAREDRQFIATVLGSSRACRNEVGAFFEFEFFVQLVAQQQQVEACLQNLRSNRQIPNEFDVECASFGNQERGKRKNEQARRRAEQRRDRVAESLKNTRRGEDDSGGDEIEGHDIEIIAPKRNDIFVL